MRNRVSSSLREPKAFVTSGTHFVTLGTDNSSLRGLLFVTPGTTVFVTPGTTMAFKPFEYAAFKKANTRARINPLT